MPEIIAREGENVPATPLEQALERPNAARGLEVPVRPFSESLRHALRGIEQTFVTQRNMRIHGVAAALAALACAILDLGGIEVLLVGAAIGCVIAAELVNTAVEAAVDLATTERHPLARVAKDAAAGAVLVCAVASVAIGAVVFGTRLFPLRLRPDGAQWAAVVAAIAVAAAVRFARLRRR
ncbi:MAG TPA: diacylglycerol kinase family protein [Vulgatibacter sp.]